MEFTEKKIKEEDDTNQKNCIISNEKPYKSISESESAKSISLSKKSLLEDIKSKYIIDTINSYIKDKNYFFKLIKYNNSLKKK